MVAPSVIDLPIAMDLAPARSMAAAPPSIPAVMFDPASFACFCMDIMARCACVAPRPLYVVTIGMRTAIRTPFIRALYSRSVSRDRGWRRPAG